MFQLVEFKGQSCVSVDCKGGHNVFLDRVYLYKWSLLFIKLTLMSLILVLLTTNTASASGWGSPVNKGFFEDEQNAFVSVPASVGSVVGSVAGAGLGVPLSILVAIPATLIAGEPAYGLFGMYLGVAAGSAAMSSIIAAPFWATKKLFYDLPFQSLEGGNN